MKLLLRLILLFAAMLTGCAGAATHLYFDLNAPYFNANPASNRWTTLQPTTPFAGNLYNYTSSVAGVFYASNLYAGNYAGVIKAKGNAGEIRFMVTVLSDDSGVVGATNRTSLQGVQTYPTAGSTAFSIQSSDNRYLRVPINNTTASDNQVLGKIGDKTSWIDQGGGVSVAAGSGITINTNGSLATISAAANTNALTLNETNYFKVATFTNIAEMSASSFTQNVAYVVGYWGTNTYGGGFFHWYGQAAATNFGTVFTNVNGGNWHRQRESTNLFRLVDFGVPPMNTDDPTTRFDAYQRLTNLTAMALATSGGAAIIELPEYGIMITQDWVVTNAFGLTIRGSSGAQGVGLTYPHRSSWIAYQGAGGANSRILYLPNAYNCKITDIGFETSTPVYTSGAYYPTNNARYGIEFDQTSPHSQICSANIIENCYAVSRGTNIAATGLAISRASTDNCEKFTIVNFGANILGNGNNTGEGVLFGNSANSRQHSLRNLSVIGGTNQIGLVCSNGGFSLDGKQNMDGLGFDYKIVSWVDSVLISDHFSENNRQCLWLGAGSSGQPLRILGYRSSHGAHTTNLPLVEIHGTTELELAHADFHLESYPTQLVFTNDLGFASTLDSHHNEYGINYPINDVRLGLTNFAGGWKTEFDDINDGQSAEYRGNIYEYTIADPTTKAKRVLFSVDATKTGLLNLSPTNSRVLIGPVPNAQSDSSLVIYPRAETSTNAPQVVFGDATIAQRFRFYDGGNVGDALLDIYATNNRNATFGVTELASGAYLKMRAKTSATKIFRSAGTSLTFENDADGSGIGQFVLNANGTTTFSPTNSGIGVQVNGTLGVSNITSIGNYPLIVTNLQFVMRNAPLTASRADGSLNFSVALSSGNVNLNDSFANSSTVSNMTAAFGYYDDAGLLREATATDLISILNNSGGSNVDFTNITVRLINSADGTWMALHRVGTAWVFTDTNSAVIQSISPLKVAFGTNIDFNGGEVLVKVNSTFSLATRPNNTDGTILGIAGAGSGSGSNVVLMAAGWDANGFKGGGAGLTNLPIRALQGSGGAGTATTNGVAGQTLLSAGNGGVYWGAGGSGGSATNVYLGATGGLSDIITNAAGDWTVRSTHYQPVWTNFVQHWSAQGDNVHDNTAPFSNAVNAFAADYSYNRALFVNPGQFLFTNPATASTNFAQVIIPQQGDYQKSSTLSIRGPGKPPNWEGSNTSGSQSTNNMGIFITTMTNNSPFIASQNWTNDTISGTSYLLFDMENIMLQAPDASAVTMLQLANVADVNLSDVSIVRSNGAGTLTSKPWSNSTAIFGPRLDMGNRMTLRNLNLVGWWTGLKAGEHIAADGLLNFVGNANGLELAANNTGNIWGGRATFQNNATNIIVSGDNYNDFANIYIERGNFGPTDWRTNVVDIFDESNQAFGTWHMLIRDNGSSTRNNLPRIVGGENLNIFMANRPHEKLGFGHSLSDITRRGTSVRYIDNTAGTIGGFFSITAAGTTAAPLAVQVGRQSAYWFGMYDGASDVFGARIGAYDPYTVGSGAIPMGLNFDTGTNAADLTTRLSISPEGNLYASNAVTVGNYLDMTSGTISNTVGLRAPNGLDLAIAGDGPASDISIAGGTGAASGAGGNISVNGGTITSAASTAGSISLTAGDVGGGGSGTPGSITLTAGSGGSGGVGKVGNINLFPGYVDDGATRGTNVIGWNPTSSIWTYNWFRGTNIFDKLTVMSNLTPSMYVSTDSRDALVSTFNGNQWTNVGQTNVVVYTNQNPVVPDFSIAVNYFQTNAAFKFLPPANVDTTKTKFETTVCIVTNSTATAVAVTAPDNVHATGTMYVTNVSVFTFSQYAQKFTNVVALPLW